MKRQGYKVQEMREETERLARSMNSFPDPSPAVGRELCTVSFLRMKLTLCDQIISIQTDCAMKFSPSPPPTHVVYSAVAVQAPSPAPYTNDGSGTRDDIEDVVDRANLPPRNVEGSSAAPPQYEAVR